MTAFARVVVAPKRRGGPMPGLPQPSDREVQRLIPRIHGALMQDSDLIDCHITAAGKQIHAIWLTSGLSAGVVFWGRPDDVEAISTFLCGLDPVEDAHALTRATGAAVARGWADVTPPDERPLVQTVFGTPEAYADTTLATIITAWAVAFFSMLGMGEPELTGSPPP